MTEELETIEEAGDSAPAKKKPPIVLILIALIVCVAMGAGAFFLAPKLLGEKSNSEAGADPENDHAAEAGGHVDSGSHEKKADSHGKKASSGHKEKHVDDGAFTIIGATAYYTPEPMVVSVRPVGRVRYLKISFAVETTADSENQFRANALRIKDVLTTYLRSLDVATIEDPAAMDRIRAQIQKRISMVVSPAPVKTVLITDFIIS